MWYSLSSTFTLTEHDGLLMPYAYIGTKESCSWADDPNGSSAAKFHLTFRSIFFTLQLVMLTSRTLDILIIERCTVFHWDPAGISASPSVNYCIVPTDASHRRKMIVY